MKRHIKLITPQKKDTNHANTKHETDFLTEVASNCSPFVKKAIQKVDRNLVRKSKLLSKDLFQILASASPGSTADLTSGIAVDLADFWQIGEEHRKTIKVLLSMRFPKDKERFNDMLYELDIRLVLHAEWHIRKLKRRLAQLRRDLKT